MYTTSMIRERLLSLADEKKRDFDRKLLPTVDPDSILGARTPDVRKLAKELFKTSDTAGFLADLPHSYYEENNLHGFLIEQIKDFGACVGELNRFLPYVDNWSTCDTIKPKVFAKNRERLLPHILVWLKSDETYTVRYGVGCLMSYFLDDGFKTEYAELVAGIPSGEYYVKMMVAWYFATALAKQYDSVLPFIENRRLEPWTHNKAIQKAAESYRITDERKRYLKSLKTPFAAK